MKEEQKSRLLIEKCKYQEDTKTACSGLCKHQPTASCTDPWTVQIRVSRINLKPNFLEAGLFWKADFLDPRKPACKKSCSPRKTVSKINGLSQNVEFSELGWLFDKRKSGLSVLCRGQSRSRRLTPVHGHSFKGITDNRVQATFTWQTAIVKWTQRDKCEVMYKHNYPRFEADTDHEAHPSPSALI